MDCGAENKKSDSMEFFRFFRLGDSDLVLFFMELVVYLILIPDAHKHLILIF